MTGGMVFSKQLLPCSDHRHVQGQAVQGEHQGPNLAIGKPAGKAGPQPGQGRQQSSLSCRGVQLWCPAVPDRTSLGPPASHLAVLGSHLQPR